MRCLRCAGKHTVKSCNELKERAKCANCGGSHATVYRGCPTYQNAVIEANKQKQETKYSRAVKRKETQNTQSLTTTTITVLVAEVLSKIRNSLNTMSYSDIISVVSNSASRVFNERIEGQEIHDNIKEANLMQTVNTNMIQYNSQQILQMDNIKILQWNCRGLENKIHELFLFLTKENIDIACLNEVKKWQKHFVHEKYFIVTEAKASNFHGSVISAKKGINVKEVRPIISRKNNNRQALEIIGVNLETPVIGNLWIINVYNSPNQDLNTAEIFDNNSQNVFICGDFNSPHQELNCTYNTENGEKLLEIIDEGNFKLLNNRYPTYQSNQHKSQSMLDLHFCSLSVLKHFDNFQVLEDFGSDHSATLTSLKLKLQVEFDLKAKVDFKKFR